MQETVQVRCPFCNAAHAANSGGHYTCDYCLQPFSVVDAQREEARLIAEIKAWVEQKVGAPTSSMSVADASSRGFIFQQRLLPDLRRDVDRSLEMLGSYGQFPLVVPPIRIAFRQTNMPNPLLAYRRQILGLKGLRARISSDEITAFTVRDNDKAVVQGFDRRVASLMHLSNVAEAAATCAPAGYQAARRNLETLAEEVGKSLALEAAGDRGLATFLDAQHRRYQALAELCRLAEEATSPNAVSGTDMARRSDQLAQTLQGIAQQIEASNYSPADTMPVVIGVQQEALACHTFGRWLRMYDVIAGSSAVPFIAFIHEMDGLTSGGHASADYQIDLLEAFGSAISVARGRIEAIVVNDFSWVQPWAEGIREKKSMGMFGVEEQVSRADQFLCPAWIAEVTFSRAAGAIFTAGHESRALAVVDAYAPHYSKVAILDHGQPLARAMSQKQVATSADVGMPRSTQGLVYPIFVQAVRARPDLLNANVRVHGLAFLPAVVVQFAANQRVRAAAACVGGVVPMEAAAQTSVALTHQLLQRFGR
jgi:hypothetical protein